MSFDPKVKRVIRRYGVEGYGLYCYFLECIARNLDEARPVPDLEETAEDIAGDLKMDSRKVEEITAYMMQQGLFDFHDATNRIVAFKMIDYLDEYHRKKGGVSKIRKALQDIEVRQCPDKLLTSSGGVAQEKNRIDKEKSKNRVEKEKKIEADFLVFYSKYPKKKSKDDAMKAFKSRYSDLPPIEELCSIIDDWSKTESWTSENKKYVPHPGKWIRAGGWDDEIPTSTPDLKSSGVYKHGGEINFDL